jgi:hypothetical protein
MTNPHHDLSNSWIPSCSVGLVLDRPFTGW